MNDSPKYEMNVLEQEKKMNIELNGFFKEEEVIHFVQDYNKMVKGINPSTHILEIDCKKLKVSSSNVLERMKDCIRMYVNTNFKKVQFILPKNEPLLQLQFKRVVGILQLEDQIDIIKE